MFIDIVPMLEDVLATANGTLPDNEKREEVKAILKYHLTKVVDEIYESIAQVRF